LLIDSAAEVEEMLRNYHNIKKGKSQRLHTNGTGNRTEKLDGDSDDSEEDDDCDDESDNSDSFINSKFN